MSRVEITRVTVAHSIPTGERTRGSEWLHVHGTAEAASEAIEDSPLSDGVMASSTTYHRAATEADVRRLRYDQHGNEVAL